MNLKKKNQVVTDDSEENSDSDATVYNGPAHKGKSRVTASNGKTKPGRRISNRQAAKRPRVSDSSERDTSPQPGPSGLSRQESSENSDVNLSETESGLVDTDFEPVKDTPVSRRGRPSKTDKAKLIKHNKSVNGVNSNKNTENHSQANSSKRKVSSNRNIANHSRANSSKRKDTSPQPGPSGLNNRDSSENSDVDQPQTEFNSADSDYEPGSDETVKKRGRLSTTLDKTKLKKHNKSVNGTTPSSAKRADPKLVESLAQKLVYFLLVEDNKKYAIKRKAITTYVFKDTNHLPKLYDDVIKKANIILKKVYGMELVQVENVKDSYLIINILDKDLGIQDYVELPELKQQQRGLILYLLTVIFMNENTITEDELTKCLKPLGIDYTSKKLHPIFGDAKKYITIELVKQMYLTYELISKETNSHELKWGIRAEQEFDKRELLQFASRVMGNSPEDWRVQFKDAKDSANLA